MHTHRLRSLGLAAALLTACAVVTAAPASSDKPSSKESLARLKTGNAAFVANPAEPLPVDAAKRAAVAKGRAPFAAIVSCAEAAVPPEIVFHAGLGDLFVVRAAGPVADRSVLASIEYAVEELHVPLVLVMGHESCGIIRSGLDDEGSANVGPNFSALLKQIRPVASRASGSGEGARLRAAILDHVEEQVNELLQDSATIRTAAEGGHVAIVGAYYELASGIVHFSEPVRVMTTAGESARHH